MHHVHYIVQDPDLVVACQVYWQGCETAWHQRMEIVREIGGTGYCGYPFGDYWHGRVSGVYFKPPQPKGWKKIRVDGSQVICEPDRRSKAALHHWDRLLAIKSPHVSAITDRLGHPCEVHSATSNAVSWASLNRLHVPGEQWVLTLPVGRDYYSEQEVPSEYPGLVELTYSEAKALFARHNELARERDGATVAAGGAR